MYITIKVSKNGQTIVNRMHTSKRTAYAELNVLVKQCQSACGGVVNEQNTFCGKKITIESLFDKYKLVTFETEGRRAKFF